MFSLLLIFLGIYIVYCLLRSGSHAAGGYGNSGMGSMFGGMVLGYLLSHYLIDQNQYDMWRNLDDDDLRDTLTSQGILNDADYNQLLGQAAEGALPGYDNSDTDLNSDANDYVAANDSSSYDDFGGGDDFGGFDA
ncbi:MAG: hypothetical protein LLG02_01430 [Pelosinus sp.]|nr:hypothetical protein [Pelosinus sp.]